MCHFAFILAWTTITTHQAVSGFYFYQDCWAARQVFHEQPPFIVDVGSTVLLVGILSQFVDCISVDIRPIESRLDGLRTVAGSVLALPFRDGEVPCLTSMYVLEHIGLGRYGDPLSATGTEDAAKEIARVVRAGGVVVFSLPVGTRSVTEFNANRRFTYDEARSLFPDWLLVDECLLIPHPVSYSLDTLQRALDPVLCLCLRKPGLIRRGGD